MSADDRRQTAEKENGSGCKAGDVMCPPCLGSGTRRRCLVLSGVLALLVVLIWVPLIFGTVHGPHTWADKLFTTGWMSCFLVSGFSLGTAFGPGVQRWVQGRRPMPRTAISSVEEER
jgi:hypothetical protein